MCVSAVHIETHNIQVRQQVIKMAKGFCSFPVSVVTPLVSAAVTIMMLVLILAPNMRGYGASNIFAYHGAFMCLAFLFFMPMGLLSYVFDFGPKGNTAYPDRASRRLLHGTANLLAALFAISGYLIAFVYHQANGITHLALDQEDKSRTAHVFIGLIALSGIGLQSIVGLWKMVTFTREGRKVLPQHGKVGPLVWVCGLLCVCLAAWFEYRENFTENKVRWLLGQVLAIWGGIFLLAITVLLQLYKGTRAHVAADSKLGMHYDALDDDEPAYAEVRGMRKGMLQ